MRHPTIRVTTTVTTDYYVPLVPNFINNGKGFATPIADIDENTLRAVGKEWTEALVRHAASRRRKQKKA